MSKRITPTPKIPGNRDTTDRVKSSHIQYRFTSVASPLQAEGSIDGRAMYFRARGRGWNLGIATEENADPVAVAMGRDPHGFQRTGKCNEEFLSERRAAHLIDRCVKEFLGQAVQPTA